MKEASIMERPTPESIAENLIRGYATLVQGRTPDGEIPPPTSQTLLDLAVACLRELTLVEKFDPAVICGLLRLGLARELEKTLEDAGRSLPERLLPRLPKVVAGTAVSDQASVVRREAHRDRAAKGLRRVTPRGVDALYHGTRYGHSILHENALYRSPFGNEGVFLTRSIEVATHFALLEGRDDAEPLGSILVLDRQSLRTRYRLEPRNEGGPDDYGECEEAVWTSITDLDRHVLGVIWIPPHAPDAAWFESAEECQRRLRSRRYELFEMKKARINVLKLAGRLRAKRSADQAVTLQPPSEGCAAAPKSAPVGCSSSPELVLPESQSAACA